MQTLIPRLGYLTAIVGTLLCALSGGMRIAGVFYLSGFEAITLLQAGTALMIFSCMIRLYFPTPSS